MTFCTATHVYCPICMTFFYDFVLEEDYRDLLCFLWFKNTNDVPLTPTTLRFTRVIFGLTSSPFLLNGTIKHHLEKYMLNPHFTEIIKKLIMNLYVDDSTNSFDKLQTAIQFYEKSKAWLKDANFELQKWATNNCVMQK